MEKIHETQSTEDFPQEDHLTSPIEDLQRIEGGVYKRNKGKISSLPKGLRYIGYFIVGFIILTLLGMIVGNLFL